MSTVAGSPLLNGRWWARSRKPLWGAFGALLLAPFAVVLAEALAHVSLSWPIVIAGAIALAGALILVIARYELAVTIGVLISAIVFVEPPPADALFVLIIVVAAVTGRFRLATLPRTAVWLVGAFLVLNLLSLSAVIDWGRAGRFFFITLYLGTFSLWLSGYLDRPGRARRLVRAYLIAGVLSAGFSVAALFIPFPFHSQLIGDGQRARGLFKDPNVYGPFLIPIALILAEEIFHPRLLRLRRSLKVACLLVLAAGVLFSYSRAAWLNLVLGLIVLIGVVVLRRPDRKAISLVMVVLTGALVLAGTIVVTGKLGFLQERAKLQGYDSQRFAAQGRGVSYGLEHIFGIGPGQFEVLSPVASHSLFIRSFAEQGPLGLLVMILIVASTLLFALVNVVRGRDTYGISAAALLAAWCGLIANSFFVDTMHWRHLWLVVGLIWAGAMRERNPGRWWRSPAAGVHAHGFPAANGSARAAVARVGATTVGAARTDGAAITPR